MQRAELDGIADELSQTEEKVTWPFETRWDSLVETHCTDTRNSLTYTEHPVLIQEKWETVCDHGGGICPPGAAQWTLLRALSHTMQATDCAVG